MLTLFMNTKDRSDLIRRQLNYYAQMGCPYRIAIADSSQEDHLLRNKETVQYFQGRLNIDHFEYPHLNLAQCTKLVAGAIKTPYMACVADGGFLVPRSLEKCVQFLEKNPDYSFANGKGVVVHLDREGSHGRITAMGEYQGMAASAEEETASARLIHHFDHYRVNLYCVHRTENWQSYWQSADLIRDKSFAGEFVPCCLGVIYGKSKQLDCLYLVRQIHGRRTALPDMFDWITGHDWSSSYEVFQDILVHALMDKDGISKEEAHKVVKRGFWHFMGKGLYDRYAWVYGTKERTLRSTIQDFIKHLIKSNQLLKKTKRVLLPLSLEGLLNRSSPYYEDFMPVYEAITKVCELSREKVEVSGV